VNVSEVPQRLEAWRKAGYPRLTPPSPHTAGTVDGHPVMCPSQSADRGTVLLGSFTADGVLEYFTELRPVAETDRAAGTGALRFAGVCHRSQCAYWNDSCQLAAAIIPPAVVSPTAKPVGATACALRDRCRWHIEHGPSACGICEAVTYTMPRHATVPVTVTVMSKPA
jgi:hypothetical protein